MKRVLVKTISIYQKTISPDHGWLRHRYPHGFCRFYPSCSEYTRLAIIEHGARRGLWLGIKRVGRCNPWSQPSVDLSYQSKYIKINNKKANHV